MFLIFHLKTTSQVCSHTWARHAFDMQVPANSKHDAQNDATSMTLWPCGSEWHDSNCKRCQDFQAWCSKCFQLWILQNPYSNPLLKRISSNVLGLVAQHIPKIGRSLLECGCEKMTSLLGIELWDINSPGLSLLLVPLQVQTEFQHSFWPIGSGEPRVVFQISRSSPNCCFAKVMPGTCPWQALKLIKRCAKHCLEMTTTSHNIHQLLPPLQRFCTAGRLHDLQETNHISPPSRINNISACWNWYVLPMTIILKEWISRFFDPLVQSPSKWQNTGSSTNHLKHTKIYKSNQKHKHTHTHCTHCRVGSHTSGWFGRWSSADIFLGLTIQPIRGAREQLESSAVLQKDAFAIFGITWRRDVPGGQSVKGIRILQMEWKLITCGNLMLEVWIWKQFNAPF